jgi:hypothetical protein
MSVRVTERAPRAAAVIPTRPHPAPSSITSFPGIDEIVGLNDKVQRVNYNRKKSSFTTD